MIPNALIRQYAAGAQIDAEVAGQDIVLHYALALLNEAGLLGRDAQGKPGPLLFKGGTALRKCVFGSTGRFSQDIDLDAIHRNGFEAQIETELQRRSPYHEIALRIAGFRYSQEGNFSGTVAYRHPHGSGTFELQISYRLDPVLEPRDLPLADQSYFPSVECPGLSGRGRGLPITLAPVADCGRAGANAAGDHMSSGATLLAPSTVTAASPRKRSCLLNGLPQTGPAYGPLTGPLTSVAPASVVTRAAAPLRGEWAREAVGARSRRPRCGRGRSCAARPRHAARPPARCVLPRAGRG
jgi:hypothetical protein